MERLTGTRRMVGVGLVALVGGGAAVAGVTHRHTAATAATAHKALAPGRAVAYGAPTLIRAPGAVVVELLLIALKPRPGNRARMGVEQHNGPCLPFDVAGASLEPWRLPRQHLRAGGRAAVDRGPGVARVMEHREDPCMREPGPHQFPLPASAPQPGGKAQAMRGDRKSTRLNSSHLVISYAVFCLKK